MLLQNYTVEAKITVGHGTHQFFVLCLKPNN